MTLQLKDVYTRLIVVLRRNVPRRCSEIGEHVQDIFGSSEERNTMVLVEGSPGIGKTTFCLKLAYDWANRRMPSTFPVFEFVFLLKCRDMDGEIMDSIMEQLLPEDIQKRTGWETFLHFLEGFDNQKRILIILDGLDELPEKSRRDVDKVLMRKIFPLCYLLVTTRKGKGIEVRKQFKFDICLEIKGFSRTESFEYIRKHFKNIEASKGERLIKLIKERPNLQELILTPLHLLLLCTVFEDCEGNFPDSNGQLYPIILSCLLERYGAKHNLKASESDIAVLGQLAWKCLLNDRLSFSENELESLERNHHFGVRGLGLVYKEESRKRLNPQHEYFFLHKTFQEYLAAFFIAHHLRRNECNIFEQVTLKGLTGKFCDVFQFVCSILDEKADILFRQISEALQGTWDLSRCDESLVDFFRGCIVCSENHKRMGDTICLFFRFPRVLHLSFTGPNCRAWMSAKFLGSCSTDSMELIPAELHITAEYFYVSSSSILSVVDDLPNVKSLIINIKDPLLEANELDELLNFPSLSALMLPAISNVTSYAAIKYYLTTSTTLEKVTFTLIGETGEGWSNVLDELIADSSLLSVGLKIYGSLSQPALQAVKNLLLNERRFSLPITIEGDCKGNQLPSCEAQLKQNILMFLLRRHCARHNLKASEKDTDLEKQFESDIAVLGQLAWKCLLNNRLSFSESELKSLEKNDHFGVRGLGLVYKEESRKRLNPQHEYFFLHKTFQEYLAAFFIAHHLRRNECNIFEQVTLKGLTGKFREVFKFVSSILDERADILFRQISETLQGTWDLSRCDESLVNFFTGCIAWSENHKRMGDTICLFFRFPRVLHLSFTGPNCRAWESAEFLCSCSTDSMELIPAELHITAEYFYLPSSSILSVVDDLPNVKSLIINIKHPLLKANELDELLNFPSLSALMLPAISDVTSYAAIKYYLTTSTTLEKVTFTLIGETGEGWSNVLDELIADSSLLSVGLKIYGSLSQPALQAVKNLLLNERRFSLPITIEGDLPDSLASVLEKRPCSTSYCQVP